MGQNLIDAPQSVENFGTVNDTAAHVQADPLILGHTTFVGIQLTTGGTLAGGASTAWIVEGSNDYAPNGDMGQPPNAGTWVNVTAYFTPALVAVLSGGSKQYIQGQFAGRALRVTFTATGGTGNATAIFNAKDL
jgi:hypothetical protein